MKFLQLVVDVLALALKPFFNMASFVFNRWRLKKAKKELNKYQVEEDIRDMDAEIKKKVDAASTEKIIKYFQKNTGV